MRMHVISARGVVRTFGDTRAVDGLDLEIPTGSVTVLLGPNGAGKTTVVRLLTGALAPDSGDISVFGIDPERPGRRRGPPPLRRRARPPRALRPAQRLRQPPLRRRAVRRRRRRPPRPHRARRRPGSGSSTRSTSGWAATRPACGPGSPSPGPCSTSPICCCSTSRPPGSTPSRPGPSSASSTRWPSEGKAVVMCTHLLLEAEGLADKVVVLDRGATLVVGVAGRADRAATGRAPGSCSTPRSPRCSTAPPTCPFVRGYSRNGVATVDLADGATPSPTSSTRSSAPAPASPGSSRRPRRSSSSTSRSGAGHVSRTRRVPPRHGRSRAPTSVSSVRRATSGCRW